MNSGLEPVFATVSWDLTAEQWADAIWLTEISGHWSAPDAPPAPSTEADTGPREGPPTEIVNRAGPEYPDPRWGRYDEQEVTGATLHLPSGQPGAPARPGLRTAVPAMSALPDKLAIMRALRPLRVRRRSRRFNGIDESATATAVAESALWTPVPKSQLIRRFDLTLVIDAGESMTVWRRTVDDFAALLEGLGAFRDSRRWSIDGDRTDVRLPTTTGVAGVTPDALVDPQGQQLVMVVSDCVSNAWRSGAMNRALGIWARRAPTVVVQMLPQRMWRRCAVPIEAVRLSRRRPTDPVRLTATNRLGRPMPAEWGLPVPVVELDARWLAPWAGLTAGILPSTDAMALFTRLPLRREAEDPDSATGPPPAAVQRVAQFRGASSPTAFQLAAYLAATPLSLPVIRLVQSAMLPESRTAHLAEFFLSGLIYPVGQNVGWSDDSVSYEFYSGVRDVLLTRLRRSDVLRVLHHVADFIHAQTGAPREFQAILALEDGGADATLSTPFARILRQVLGTLGGSYARVAETATGVALGHAEPVADSRLTSDIEGVDTPTRKALSAHGGDQRPRGGALSSPDFTRGDLEGRPPVIFDGVPTRNPNFTGREELLIQLRDRLAASTATALLPQALHGLGGVGKTQLAVEFCHRFASSYDLICWIPAEQSALARGTLAALAQSSTCPAPTISPKRSPRFVKHCGGELLTPDGFWFSTTLRCRPSWRR